VSSELHQSGVIKWDDLMSEKSFSFIHTYKQSKLANVMFTKELQRRVAGDNIKVVGMCPGFIETDLNKELKDKWYWRMMIQCMRLFQHSVLEGAQTPLYCALEDEEKLVSGGYYSNVKLKPENKLARDEESNRKLWEISEKLIADAEKAKN